MLQSLLGKIGSNVSEDGRVDGGASIPDVSRVLPQSRSSREESNSHEKSAAFLNTAELGSRAEIACEDLSAQFDAWMRRDLIKLIGSWTELQSDLHSEEKNRSLFINSHNIRGVAGAYGYEAISRICGSLCTLLSKGNAVENEGLINLHIESCRSVFLMVQRTGGPSVDAVSMCEALERHVEKKTAEECSAD